MQLKNQLLLKNQCLIDGKWVKNGSEKLRVINPSTGKVIETIPMISESQVKEAISAASVAYESWKELTAEERSLYLRKWFDLVVENELDLAQIISSEQGKPLEEALAEVKYGASYIEWFAEEAKRIKGDVLSRKEANSAVLVTKEPIGVCGLITPWNFPIAMVTRKISPALAAGCTVVVKPSEETPFSALALAELAISAGIPKGVINVITGDGVLVGNVFTSSPIMNLISFTGSTRVGEILKSACVPTHKRTIMELGGNSPFIVFEDADIEEVMQAFLRAKFRNAGQACVAANRILVHHKIYSQFLEKIKNVIPQLAVGDAYAEGVKIGPLINENAVKKVDEMVKDTVASGAELVLGGDRHALGGCFYEPTIVTKVTSEMRLFKEEIFGPIVAITIFNDDDEAFELANQTQGGLAAYFFTKSLTKIYKVSRGLQYGMIGVNTGAISYPSIPFGGMGYSGEGREGSYFGIEEYLEIKYTNICGI